MQKKHSLTAISLLLTIVIISSILNCAMGHGDRLFIQNRDVYPTVAKIGDIVKVSVNIRNNGEDHKKCNFKAYVRGSVVEERKDIKVLPQTTFPILFTFNTSSLPEGKHPVEAIIEQTSSEQAKFDLGTITVEQEELMQDSAISVNSNIFYLLAVLPVGAVVSFFVWKRRRNKRKEDAMPEGLLPNLLNEVLNFEENVETGAVKNENSSNDKSYVC